ncbi:MAG: hypothetical protein M1822_003822 [Bathelium mastoideum]|nr:MAG: hypothetical protein M1822_003822 [Bathelium mastoideum]
MAAIAFAHNGYGYSAQLPICTLPVRPFWYRLALMWVPRYIIWTIVLGLAVCVYRYVGGEFGTLSADTVSATASGLDTTTSTTAKPMGKSGSSPITDTDPPIEEAITLQNLPNMPPVSRTRFSPFPPKVLAAVHKAAASGQVIAPFQHRSAGPGFGLTGSEQGRVAVRDPLARPTEGTASSHPSLPANSTVQMAGTSRTRQEVDNASDRSSPSPKRILQNQSRPVEAERNSIAKTKQGLETLSVDPAFAKRRRAIIHQLRLLFIYPILYIALWLVPFILHCYQYNDYYAKYPPFVLTLLAYFSLSIMGAVNGIVFNVKERPWRHISGSDATFWGSFCWWRTRSASVPNFSSQYNEQERSNADAITSTVGGGSTMGSMSRQSAEIDSCPIALNQPPPLMRMGSFREFRTASPSAVADAGRSTFPRQQRRSEAERKQADQAYARLAAEIADRQQSQQQESLEAASISEAQSSSMVAPPARPSLNWWDRQLSGLTEFSVEDEMERQAQGEDDGSIRAKSAVPEQERQDGSAAIV